MIGLAMFARTLCAQSVTNVFDSDTTFVMPPGVTTLTVQTWGGGGRGGTRTTNGSGGGGGGGAYAASTITVAPGHTNTIKIGVGSSSNSSPGGDTWFSTNNVQGGAVVLAKGGSTVANNSTNGASGGAASASLGNVRYSGGNGANGSSGGGGGGSSAGISANGNNGNNHTGATAPNGGGNGGDGHSSSQGNGSPGVVPGGGGGGGYRTSRLTRNGGNGANGRVVVSYVIQPHSIAFISQPLAVVEGYTSAPLTIRLESVNGYSAQSIGTTTINLQSNLPGTFRDLANTTNISSVVISNGSSQVSFRFRSNSVGTHLLTASDNNNVLLSGTQSLVVKSFSAQPAPVQTFYMPLPAAEMLQFFKVLNSAAQNPMYYYGGIAVSSADTLIYYDQMEDGYEEYINAPLSLYDAVNNPSGTQIWGDGDLSNGVAPGFPNDIIPPGSAVILSNAIDSTVSPTPNAPKFNAGDRIGVTKSCAFSASIWASNSSTLLSDAIEVADTYNWGREYRVPMGTDINANLQNSVFEYVGASIMAGRGGATVRIDADANGTFESTVHLSEGQTHLINNGLMVGARISSDNPVHLTILTGDIGANYESRWFPILPVDRWESSYYSPVSTPDKSFMPNAPASGIQTLVWLYNPSNSAIQVTYARRSGSNLISDIANKGVSYGATNMPDSAYGNIYGPIVELNSDGSLSSTPEGAWIGIVNRSSNNNPSISTKVANAQTAGAAAVIIVNNTGNTTFPTDTAGTGRIIPVVGMTQNGGAALRSAGLGSGWVRVSGSQTTSTITVPANGVARQIMVDGYGGHFYSSSGAIFYALSTTDATSTSGSSLNQAWDWGFALVPESALTRQVLVGFGFGRDPIADENPNENGSPIWVTTIGNGDTNVTVYVDFDADPTTGAFTDTYGSKYDMALTMRELELAKVYNPSGNQNGMLIYVLDRDVKITAAWGQDPMQASTGEPGFDAGTLVPPLPLFAASKSAILTADNDGDGFISPGDGIDYIIKITNISRTPVDDMTLMDTPPPSLHYTSNSTYFINHLSVTSTIPDKPKAPEGFPLDGSVLPNPSLPPAQSWTVRYSTVIKPFDEIPLNTTNIINAALVNSMAVDDPIELDSLEPLMGKIGQYVWHDINANGIRDVGEDGIAGVTVKLYNQNNVLVDTQVTDGRGYYLFTGVKGNNYYVVFAAPAGYRRSPQDADAQGVNGPNNSDVVAGTGISPVVTLHSGEINNNVDAGLALKPGSIGDRIWLDENGDGIQDGGEDGIANVKVELYNSDNVLLATTYTDTEGNYLFNRVCLGDYTVRVDPTSLPTGLAANPTYDEDGTDTPHQSEVTINCGDRHLTADFGYNWAPPDDTIKNQGLGAIGDRVWIDANGNGLQDPGEPGMGGVTVTLYYDHNHNGVYDAPYTVDGYVATRTTTADGQYIFDDLPPGAYVVVVNGGTTPTGYTQTGDPDYYGATLAQGQGDNRTTAPVIVAPGDVFVNADFGYQPLLGVAGFIGDRVWLDLNGDGIQDQAETGIVGVSVALVRDSNGNGVWDGGERIIATTRTSGNGEYLFSGLTVADALDSNNYIVWVNDITALLTGLQPTFDYDGLAPTNGVRVGYNISTATNLTASGTVAHDFGHTAVGHSSNKGLIGDTVFLDKNNNGLYDVGEGIPGVTLYLYAADGVSLLAVTMTDANGNYWFGGLADATYTVRVDTTTLPNGGVGFTNTVDPDQPSGNSQSRVVISGANIDLNQDFGYRATATPNAIGGTVWEDRNADGTLNSGESALGLAGITVALRDELGNVIATTTTDANGDYLFSGLPNGIYSIRVTDERNLIAGWWHSIGSNHGADNNSQITRYTVELSGGQTNTTADFGYYYRPGALGNFVWNDLNANGLQDVGEPGLSNVVVTLTITYSNLVETTVVTTTDGSGHYLFGNLLLDEDYNGLRVGEPTHVVAITMPPEWFATPFDVGEDDTRDSDNHSGAAAVVVKGAINETLDFGLYRLARLYGYAFWDKDESLTRSEGDGIATGMVVQVWRENVLLGGTNTDENGFYEFNNLIPAAYEVRFFGSTNSLIALPQSDPALTNPERNRAAIDPGDYAVAHYAIYSGHGMRGDIGEPVNAGFSGGGPLSSGIDLRAYQGADGVYVEFLAHDVESDGTITLYLLEDGQNVVWQGQVEVVMADHQIARFKVPGLELGGRYNFAMRDEVGNIWFVNGLEVKPFAMDYISMTREGILLSFATMPQRTYDIEWTPTLGGTWRVITSVTALENKTTLLVRNPDPDSPSGFFRVKLR